MKWVHYLALFGAGLFLGNAVPHFTSGVSGQMFPTPFADPPGFGLSTPLTNTLWGLFNLLVGYGLLRTGKAEAANRASILAVFLGVATIGIALSIHFGSVMGGAG